VQTTVRNLPIDPDKYDEAKKLAKKLGTHGTTEYKLQEKALAQFGIVVTGWTPSRPPDAPDAPILSVYMAGGGDLKQALTEFQGAKDDLSATLTKWLDGVLAVPIAQDPCIFLEERIAAI
jgi:hypothetical protein